MSLVGHILTHKGSHVLTISREASVYDASLIMNEHAIGALVVCDAGQVVGIFTERDILRRVVAENRDARLTRVGQAMSHPVLCVRSSTTSDEAAALMQRRRVRHLPVVAEDGRLEGVISIGDLNAQRVCEQEQTIESLREYLYGSIAP